MKHGKIYVAGIGPGSEEDITPAVRTAIMQSDVVVGYKYYFNFIRSIVRPETECIDTGMKKEKDQFPFNCLTPVIRPRCPLGIFPPFLYAPG